MMSVRTLSFRVLLFLGLCQVGRRGLASASELRAPPRKIAIVGAGIGGTAAAYFLRQEFGSSVKLDVYEAGTVGGRLATESIEGQDYETGGSIIHPLNLHMKHFVNRIGLSVRAEVPSKMAIFDGKELMFEESDWFIVNFLRMLWHYGFNSLRMHMWVESLLDKFMRIYQYQQFSYSFSSVDRMLHAMGGDDFLALLNQTLEEAMLAHGFSQAFINEIVTPISRVNYGQSVRLHAFAGSVSLAGAESGLWAVDGGNKRICSGLLYHSKAQLIPARVTNIALKTRSSKSTTANLYEVSYVEDSGSAHSLYDVVILATPLHQGLSDITFSGFSPSLPSHFPGHYHQTVSTLVLGCLNVSYLDASRKPGELFVSDVFTTDNEKLGFASLSSLNPVHITPGYSSPSVSETAVWKVFSPKPLTEEQLRTLFVSREHVVEKRWLAYPSYRAPERQAPPFILHHSLYYLSPIEWAASSMEMSALSAQNIALLAKHRWHGDTSKVDQEGLHARLRGEL
ncbi:prenylcysteine oxidase 1 isoform X2 [Neoarius graeffei]|uniref:prenylcysteine oxidase 1 isoform X2 n=1 Tax=Neoarius graeffei TaxID=443677 RepID=UPI00298C9970|nr:prenylcysteine oxidase 1 isoform X2 [Neoarius graeffei]